MTFATNIRMPYMPMHSAGASLELRWQSGSFLVSGHYQGLRWHDYSPKENVGKLDPVFLLDISVQQKAGKTWTFFAALRNALNASYVSVRDYPMPGVSLTLGAKAAHE
jgi:vitamin B12 transporter